MTLVLGTKEHTGGPQTHVLIIGVGRYKHLQGGEAPTPNVPPLGQLKSPPVSARALADWFTSGAYRNDATLGSVELLLSDANTDQYDLRDGSAAKVIEAANMANIMRAFNEWYARCDADKGNVCFFYFCGHGLERDASILLPEDFAENPNNPWLTAIDFNRTYRGMAQCRAQTQYYVVDACRQWTTSMLQDLDVGGQTLKRASVLDSHERTAPMIFATASGLPAFGDTGDVSRLTAALIECLDGGGAEKHNGTWQVSTSRLGESVQKLVNMKNDGLPKEHRQIVNPAVGDYGAGPRVLHKLPNGKIPEVVVTFVCSPDAATPNACFYLQRQGERQDAPAPGLWTKRLKAGVYDFGVNFPQGTYREWMMSEETILPPVWPVKLEV